MPKNTPKKIIGYNYDQNMYVLDDGSLLHPIEKIQAEDEYHRKRLAGWRLLLMLGIMEAL